MSRNSCGVRVERIFTGKPKPVHYVKRCWNNKQAQAVRIGNRWGCIRVDRRRYRTPASFCNRVAGARTLLVRG